MTIFTNIRIVGLGPEGLALTRHASSHGVSVVGFDPDAVKVAQLKDKQLFTSDERALSGADAFIVAALPAEIEQLTHRVALFLTEGALVVVETPLPVGASEKKLLPLIERTSELTRHEFHFAHSPAAGLPTRPLGAFTPQAYDTAHALYELLGIETTHMPSLRETEALSMVLHGLSQVQDAYLQEFRVALARAGIRAEAIERVADLKPPLQNAEAVRLSNVLDLQMLSVANRILVRLSRQKRLGSERVSALNDANKDRDDRDNKKNVNKSSKRVRRKKTDEP